ncbi:MAG: ribose 5-phosphate isomerase B [Microthrixaceae bacterium]|nr:ribose 5-phosphate isomerase B [Microthrixaceae bacterium]
MSRIAVGADHAGFRLKQLLAGRLLVLGHEVDDHGTMSEERVDYPDFAVSVARAVAGGDAELGVLVCGSGVGVSIAANKVAGIRAATVHDFTSARLAREHNDANIVCLGARFIGEQVAIDALDAFLDAGFEGGRHVERVAKITALDAQLTQ